MNRALLATDLSKASDLLFDGLEQYRSLGIEHISLLHIPAISFNYMEYSGYSMRVHIEARMIALRNRVVDMGMSCQFVFREGLPSQEIVDYAHAQSFDLIIMGSKGQGFFKRNLIGSTTLRVIQQSRIPVLMMRIRSLGEDSKGEHQCALDAPDLTRNALLLTDFSRHAGEAFRFAEDHLVEHLQGLSLMHVQDKIVMMHHEPATIARFNEIDNKRLSQCTLNLRRKTTAPVRCVLTEGAVVPEIMREAKLNQVSLIIMGTHGKGYFSEMVMGSTAYAIVQLVETNCLLVPAFDSE